MIIVAGEALIDCLPARCGDEDGFVPRAGGSPYNVARGLARLEVPVGYLGRVSTDPFGRILLDGLAADGVELGLVARVADPSPLAIVHVDEAGGASYSFHLQGSAPAGLALGDLPDPLPPWLRAVHTGSLALLLEPGVEATESLLQRARAAGRLTSLDPNVRPALAGTREQYRQRLQAWLEHTDLAKASEEDLAWLQPDADPVGLVRDWTRHGPAVAILTRGGAGAVAVAGDRTVAVPGEPVDVADTIGAGDAFTSGLLAWLAQRDALDVRAVRSLGDEAWREALGFAGLVAGRTCARFGADPPWRGEL